jgi:fatty acid desaturase
MGYALILLMPALLAIGTLASRPYLAIGVAFLLLPLMRIAFGAYRNAHATAWREGVATFLHWLPAGYAALLVASELVVALWLGTHEAAGLATRIGLGLSLWITLLFGLCSAHELLHRRSRLERLVGAALAGALGYPALALEHPMHHAREGREDLAEWPRFEESVWSFAARRLMRVGAEYASTLTTLESSPLASPLRTQAIVALASTGVILGLFLGLAGIAGLEIYLLAALGCALGMQIMTYLQHWALADPRWVTERPQPLAWEDDCQFQAWITLHISFHQRHHQDASIPYYRLGMDVASPRLPAGYIVMMVICLVPAIWRRAMLPALMEWKSDPGAHASPGRRLTCFGLYQTPADGIHLNSGN